MASVELLINNRAYTIACDPGEEPRVKTLGAMVDERARQLGLAASDAQRFLMVCLLLADELDEAKSKPRPAAAEGAEDEDLLVAAVEHLANRIDHIAASLVRT